MKSNEDDDDEIKKYIDKYHEYLTRKKQRIEEKIKKKLINELK